jgi:hypothetical protein
MPMRFLFVLLILSAWAGICFAASPTHPNGSWVLAEDCTFTAKDKSFSIRQYYNEKLGWQIWVAPKDRAAYLLPDINPDFQTSESAATWHLSPDAHWLARSQRLGSGTSTLHLYHCEKNQSILPVTPDPLGDLARKFYERHSGLTRDQCFIDHPRSEFVRWEGSGVLILALSGQSTMCEPMWVTDQWLVGYDLKNRKFFLTDDLIEKNERRIYPVVHPISETAADLR